MSLNKKFVKMRKDKRAEMGVGTMIIFIAMVLVAAVAASVLISTANQVREQAQSTGDQAINGVASGFLVHDVVGAVDVEELEVTKITLYLRLAPGSPNINMANVMISLVSGSLNQMLAMSDTATATTDYGAKKIQPVPTEGATDDTWKAGNYVVAQDDMIEITIVFEAGSGIGLSQAGVIKIMPTPGQNYVVNFVTPNHFSAETISLA